MSQSAKVSDILEVFVRSQGPAEPKAPVEMRALLSYIHEHLFDFDLSVKTTMNRCALHDNNITSRFRIFIGVGMKEYIESLRMKAALHLLEEPELPVIDIAVYLGYEHPQTFFRTFHRHYGCTPSAYRNQTE